MTPDFFLILLPSVAFVSCPDACICRGASFHSVFLCCIISLQHTVSAQKTHMREHVLCLPPVLKTPVLKVHLSFSHFVGRGMKVDRIADERVGALSRAYD